MRFTPAGFALSLALALSASVGHSAPPQVLDPRAAALVARANGVGPKLAQRIVTELKGKPIADGPVSAGLPRHDGELSPAAPSASGEAIAALMGLGVAEINARRVVEQAAGRLGEAATVQALIKSGLQELGR